MIILTYSTILSNFKTTPNCNFLNGSIISFYPDRQCCRLYFFTTHLFYFFYSPLACPISSHVFFQQKLCVSFVFFISFLSLFSLIHSFFFIPFLPTSVHLFSFTQFIHFFSFYFLFPFQFLLLLPLLFFL